MRSITGYKRKVLILALIATYFAIAYALLDRFDITCVFLALFRIPCPGCGMTRALASLLKLDFYRAAQHNVVIFFMPYVVAYLMFEFRHKIHGVLLSIIATIAIVNWLIKLKLFVC